MRNQFTKDINSIAKDLQLPKQFIEKLMKEDDWSFVIKSYSLLEGAVAFLLTKTAKQEKFYETFARLGMNAKINALKDLDLIGNDHLKLLRLLSQLRNTFIHPDPRRPIVNVNLSISEYLSKSNNQQRISFIQAFDFLEREITLKGKRISRDKFVEDNPRVAIFMGVLSVLAVLSLSKQEILLQRRKEGLIRRKAGLLDKLLKFRHAAT